MRKNKRAFTLVEMLLATIMVAIVSLALNTMLINGIKVWMFVNKESPEIDMNLFFERLNADAGNSFYAKNYKFSGDAEKCSFAALVPGKQFAGGFTSVPGAVIYSFDKDAETLNVEYLDRSELFADTRSAPRVLVKNAEKAEFSYYYYDQQKKEFFWSAQWPPDKYYGTNILMPLALKVTVSLKDGELIKTDTRTVRFFVGGLASIPQ